MGERTCVDCGKTGDLRPYGPKGAMICFKCAMGTPDRKAEAERQFDAQLDGIKGHAVIDGTEVGPYPLDVLERMVKRGLRS